jgi:hypothetical protein
MIIGMTFVMVYANSIENVEEGKECAEQAGEYLK